MDKCYKLQLRNKSLKAKLLNKDNVIILENILENEIRKFERLQKLKVNEKLNFGKKLSSNELNEIFPNICSQVDDFLDIQYGSVPRCNYFNLFSNDGIEKMTLLGYGVTASLFATFSTCYYINPNAEYLLNSGVAYLELFLVSLVHTTLKNNSYFMGDIFLKKSRRTDLIPVAGHEYAHHVQYMNDICSCNHGIFEEGVSIRTQNYLAEKYSEIEDNEAFIYFTSYRNVNDFKRVYRWMCKTLDINSNKNLIKCKSYFDLLDSAFFQPSNHALGNSLFSIYEAVNGKEIYKDVFQGEFSFIL